MDWITPTIAIWEYPSSKTDLGQFNSILNLDRFNPYHTDVHHTHMPIIDGRGNTPEEIVAVLEQLDRLVDRGRVLVHCASGVSRSPFILALYLAWKRQMPFQEAVETVASRRSRQLNIDTELLKMASEVLELVNGGGPGR